MALPLVTGPLSVFNSTLLIVLAPDIRIIRAHPGLATPANEIYDLIVEYPDLLADISLRE